MANAYTVLVVDDEPPILRFLRASLRAAGHNVVTAEIAAQALTMFPVEKPDVVILDLGLPDRSGFEVITEIRKNSPVPIIVLSARDDERSKVQALDLGADDYIGKPFGMAELMARVRAALRHRFQAQGELPNFVSGDLSVDLVRRHATRAGQEVKLSPKEFEAGTARFNNLSPVSYALAKADAENLPWVVVLHGDRLRLYPTAVGVCVGRRGRTETYVEIQTSLLADEHLAYLWLLFSAEALDPKGIVADLLDASTRFAGDLAGRLRERIYKEVLPRLGITFAQAAAHRRRMRSVLQQSLLEAMEEAR
jgi:DNA-binding response OmpR family regulator